MEIACGNIFIRPMLFERKGFQVGGHAHNFDHTTIITLGQVRIQKLKPVGFDAEGVPTGFEVAAEVVKTAGALDCFVRIDAGVWHNLIAETDAATGLCVYAHRLPQNLVEHADKAAEVDAEYTALLGRIIDLANQRFGTIVQQHTGWEQAYC
jgi:hypothetical protein